MIDLIFIAATLAFFALMLAYAKGCKALGRDRSNDPAAKP